jgi:glycosyltransferase involved in cell wall biosynthesis
MKKVVHVLTHLGGGVGQVLTNIAAQSEKMGGYSHEFFCLDEISPFSKKLIEERKIKAHARASFEAIYRACESADLVQIDWWNHPLINEFLSLAELPAARLLVYSHISGFQPPLTFTKEILAYADIFGLSTPFSLEHELIRSLPTNEREEKIRVIFIAGGSTDRVKNLSPRKHDGFNVSYIGTVDFCKMHPEFVAMSAAAQAPGIKYIVCGGGMQDVLLRQAQDLGKADRFEFKGFVEDIRSIFEVSDVFGYPLCDGHYGTGEQALLEAMAAGVPPVVFAHGAERYIVKDGVTGILVSSPEQYTNAIERLFRDPAERKRLGENARTYAEEHFTLQATTAKFQSAYDELMARPKRERKYVRRYSGSTHLDRSNPLLGTHVFLNSLGEHGRDFEVSLDSKDTQALLAADENIATRYPGMKAKTRGSVFHYLGAFPQDAYLRFWCALVLQGSGEHREAIEYFQQALKAGFAHWRIHWHLARSAKALGDLALAESSLSRVPSPYSRTT